jgi:hypothetical protein
MFKRLKGSIGKIDEPKSSNSVPQVRRLFEIIMYGIVLVHLINI